MRLNVIAIGQKMPDWIKKGVAEYHKRMPREYPLTLTEIPLKKEAQLLSLLPTFTTTHTLNIALDEHGESFTTIALAKKILHFEKEHSQMNLFIGGPDGFSKECLAKIPLHWSLSLLTLPHPLVRVLLIEQLYRAVSIIQKHPYHRQ